MYTSGRIEGVMANTTVFQTKSKKHTPPTNTVNQAGAPAYAFETKHALAQLATTGTFNDTFYGNGKDQLEQVLEKAKHVDSMFLAKLAVYARQKGYMKDMPALLCAVLAARQSDLLRTVFPLVIDNGKMLRNFVQIIRSGVTGRKSLGHGPRKLVERWIQAQETRGLLRASIGTSPTLRDVMRMVRPKPLNAERAALYAWLVGKEEMQAWGKKDVKTNIAFHLPKDVHDFTVWQRGQSNEIPNVPFEMLVGNAKDQKTWTAIAMMATWTQLRMNLNTFQRHGVFEDEQVVKILAARLADKEKVQKSKVFPYQLLAAYTHADQIPHELREALQDAMEVAVENVPAVDGKVYLFPDVSGSMTSSITGVRAGATSKVRCIDVAALVASVFLRQNRSAEVLPFEDHVVPIPMNPRDSVMTNAKKLAAIGGGGTDCASVLHLLNERNANGDLGIYISDNQSWMGDYHSGTTPAAREWAKFKQRNPKAKLVCLDIQSYTNTQITGGDVLNLGGFSDTVFDLIASFSRGELNPESWVGEIEKIDLEASPPAQ